VISAQHHSKANPCANTS